MKCHRSGPAKRLDRRNVHSSLYVLGLSLGSRPPPSDIQFINQPIDGLLQKAVSKSSSRAEGIHDLTGTDLYSLIDL